MKLAFAHDHIFQQDGKGNLFTGGSFNNQVWKRYLQHFDEITVLARVQDLKEADNRIYNPFDLKAVKLVPVPSLSGPVKQVSNRKQAKEIIGEVLQNSDLLVARLPSETGNLAIKIARESGKPYLVEVVACVWDALWNYGKPLAKIYAPVALHKMKKRVYDSPFTIYVTNEFLQKRYPSNGQTISISNVEIREVSEVAFEIRSERLNKGHTYQIGMIGSLKNRIKGWDVAFKALSSLSQKDFVFNILGDGEPGQWEEMAEELNILEKVKFWGVLPGGEAVLNWLDRLDLYIQPSFQEGLPRAVIEAMSRGCPVAGSDAGGIPELIDKSCIHRAGDFVGLSDQIKKIMTDKEYAMKLTKMNLETARQYQKSVLDKRRAEFFNRVIQESQLRAEKGSYNE